VVQGNCELAIVLYPCNDYFLNGLAEMMIVCCKTCWPIINPPSSSPTFNPIKEGKHYLFIIGFYFCCKIMMPYKFFFVKLKLPVFNLIVSVSLGLSSEQVNYLGGAAFFDPI
jgi:hypothetical protein